VNDELDRALWKAWSDFDTDEAVVWTRATGASCASLLSPAMAVAIDLALTGRMITADEDNYLRDNLTWE